MPLLRLGTAIMSVAGMLALILLVLAKRIVEADDVGSVNRIAAHRANST